MYYWQTICTKENLTISELISPCTNSYCNTYCLTQWHTSASCSKTSNLFHIVCPRERDIFIIEICSTAPLAGIRRWFQHTEWVTPLDIMKYTHFTVMLSR